MADFFDQLLQSLAQEAQKHPGFQLSEAAKQALASAPRAPHPAPAPHAVSRPVPPSVPPCVAPPSTPPRPTPVYRPPTAGVAVERDPNFQFGHTLEELCQQVQTCRRCTLCQERCKPVFGEGNPHAELMFIGEGPGYDEDQQGRPFVGRAGQLLDKMIAAMQFTREEVYIGNIVKCRPPRNRVPAPDEAATCIGYLQRQIELIQPKAIVLLGATAANFLLQRHEGITRLRGRWLEYHGIPTMPTFHPAFLLRQESAKREAWEDLKKVMLMFGHQPPPPRRVRR